MKQNTQFIFLIVLSLGLLTTCENQSGTTDARSTSGQSKDSSSQKNGKSGQNVSIKTLGDGPTKLVKAFNKLTKKKRLLMILSPT